MTAAEYFELGVKLAEAGNLGGALEALEECVVRNPEHGDACKLLARLSLQANELRAFSNWLHEAQRIDRNDPEPHILLAEHLVERKRWEEADLEVRAALRKNPSEEQVERLAHAQARIPEYF